MKIRPEIEIYPDPKYCGCIEDESCNMLDREGKKGVCGLYIVNWDKTPLEYCEKADEFKKCDQCKADYLNAEQKPKVIVLCGSTRFCQQMAVVAWYLEKEEGVIVMGLHLLPWWYPDVENIPSHLAEHEGVKEHCDNLHMRKIDLADEIFVVDVDCYTGNSTKREIEYAINRGLPIRYYSAEPMGLRVDGIYHAATKKASKMDDCKTMGSKFKGGIVELNEFLECGKCPYLKNCLVPQYLLESK